MEDTGIDLLNTLLSVFQTLPAWLQAIIILITGIISLATTFTLATPTKFDDKKLPLLIKPLNKALAFFNILAGNVAHNKNADAE